MSNRVACMFRERVISLKSFKLNFHYFKKNQEKDMI